MYNLYLTQTLANSQRMSKFTVIIIALSVTALKGLPGAVGDSAESGKNCDYRSEFPTICKTINDFVLKIKKS